MRWLPFLLLLLSSVCLAKVKVVTSTTDLAWAVGQIGGELVEVDSLLKGTENPHYVDTIPSFIQKVSNADVVCVVGLDLEVGWMPKVLAKSGNAKVQPGGTGYCETGKTVAVIEKPAGAIDRSMGDVHPQGNPHFWLSPHHLGEASKEIARVLSDADPVHSAQYENGRKALEARLTKLEQLNRKRLAAATKQLTGPALMEYHKEFSYFFDTYQLKSMGSLEEKPGVPPSAGRIGEVALSAKNAGLKALVASETNPRKLLDRFTEISGIRVLRVTTSVPKGEDYEKWHSDLVTAIVEALNGKKAS